MTMARTRILGLLALLFALATLARGNQYLPSVFGMQCLEIFCDSEEKLEFLMQYKDHPDFELVKIPKNRTKPVHVLAAAKELKSFKSNLRLHNIEHSVFVEDLSKLIAEERTIPESTRTRRDDSQFLLDHFPQYKEIAHHVRALASAHPEVAESFTIGRSYEGRDIVGVKISKNIDEDKPILLIDAGIHAREWIAPTTALYAIKQLIENSTNHYIFDNVDIYIVPSLNPDGYTYSQANNETRLWRKTRSKNENSTCMGVDGNRNYEFQWMTIGASADPCSDIYAGSQPFSEPETSALRDFILEKNNSVKVYVSLHSYGNFILHPWAYTRNVPKNEPLLRCVGEDAANEIEKIRGTRFEVGSSTNLLSSGAGSADDWALSLGGVELAFTIELGDDKYTFASPTTEIEPAGQEFMELVKVMAKYMEGKICQNYTNELDSALTAVK